jgi:4-amino-4-deoxy-L-arabinose transferase-like glycosyltransferase
LSAASFAASLPERGWLAYLVLGLFSLCLFLPGISALPPVDRDEARFAQASRQMVESGDYVNIRFQDKARHKKPAGVYWLQAASARAFGAIGSNRIWPYRVPSTLGALGAVLFLFAFARGPYGRQTAFFAALMLAASVVLTVEAHLGKADALLLAAVIIAQGALCRVYLRGNAGEPVAAATAIVFWAAQGAAILIKGPIGPAISALTIIALVIADRRAAWLKGLRPLLGPVIAAAIAAPWFIAISYETGGAFLADAVGKDLLPKLLSGQESHGAPPGAYSLAMAVTFWPGSLLAFPALLWAWRHRADKAVRYCLAWLLPAWLLFELIPTKLPHYVLPLYPALALICAGAALDGTGELARLARSVVGRGFMVLWGAAGLTIGIAITGVSWWLEGGITVAGAVPAAGAIVAVGLSLWFAFRDRLIDAVAAATLGAVIVYASALGIVLPATESLWLSRSAALAVARHGQGAPVAVAGYGEPSIVFALGTATRLISPDGAAKHVAETPGALALIAKSHEARFLEVSENLGRQPKLLQTLSGLNYSRGRPVTLVLYGGGREPMGGVRTKR